MNVKIPSLKIGDLIAKLPIIQGGMGIGVSGANLASAVAREGGIGIISGVQIGYKKDAFASNPLPENMKALAEVIRKAKENSNGGIVGINFMVAMRHYDEYVKAAVKEKIDLIISGAGLPIQLPSLVEGSKTKIAPIVSSGKAARIIIKRWLKQDRLPDAVVVEGPLAGGHLGFKYETLVSPDCPTVEELVKEVIDVVKPFEEKYNKEIPVIAAGGIMTGEDIANALKIGAAGVQMGTRFVATEECDANDAFKETYVNCAEEDIQLLKSPVGLPGRGIRNPFMDRSKDGRIPVKKCFKCIGHCDPKTTPYCISQALIDAVIGEDGLVFSGARAHEITEITTVKDLMQELATGIENS